MDRASLCRTTLAVLAATAALAGPARAQLEPPPAPRTHGPLLGLAVGISNTSERGAGRSRTTSSAELRAGWDVSPQAAGMVEAALHGFGGDRPDNFYGSLDPAATVAPPDSKLVGTFSVLASVQVAGPAGVYVRPGAGFAQHEYVAWQVISDNGAPLYMSQVAHEWGPAAGVAVGHEVRVPHWMPLQVEAVALWSRGEDGTGPRWSAGVQIAHDVRF